MARADQSIADLVKNFSADGLGTRDRAEDSEAYNFRPLLVETGIAICLATGVGVFLGRHLSRPLVQLFHCIETLAAGNLDYELARRRDEIGAVAGATMVFREAMRRNAQTNKDQFRAALSNMSQGLCMFDSADRLIVANARMAEMLAMPATRFATGMTFENILGKTIGVSNQRQVDIDTLYCTIGHLKAAGVPSDSLCELTDDRTLAVNFVPVAGGGWLVTLEDITQRRLAEAKITFMARHDALTGLPDRALFHDRLKEAVARSRRGEPCAVLYLDLDHFKAVNDTLGHPVGDALLREVTERLGQQVREVDTVARLGGDEFAIIQSSVDQPGGATALAKRLVEAVSQPYDLGSNQVIIGTSIGSPSCRATVRTRTNL
jgi:diguanylate cyclase (GGDEF)-like protein